ncbi:TNFAIP3-interacting protein 1-like [Saccostrea echinata]|uniref:TNFAIP3-interacting protein 1-like n=1 Tax=Saccostrea echinata TaxID=191078 RepID=UPI002A7F438A|nr:TNFAIP3-interacting protein 1-like [Saccostrea echinata]
MELKGKGYSAGHSSGTATPLSSDSEEDAIKNNDNQKMEDIIFALRTKIRLDAKNFQEENEKIRNEASQKITELKESLQDREDEITEIQIKHKREIREKIKQIDELERNIQKAEKGISVLQETNKELLKNKAEQSEEREKVMTEVAMLKEELNDVYKSLEQMKKEMNDMQSSSEQSKSDLKESKPKEGSSDSRIEMLGADLLKANSEIDRLIKLHSKEIQKVREQYKKIKSQNDGLKSDISELLTEMKEMRKEVKEVKEFQMPQGNKN